MRQHYNKFNNGLSRNNQTQITHDGRKLMKGVSLGHLSEEEDDFGHSTPSYRRQPHQTHSTNYVSGGVNNGGAKPNSNTKRKQQQHHQQARLEKRLSSGHTSSQRFLSPVDTVQIGREDTQQTEKTRGRSMSRRSDILDVKIKSSGVPPEKHMQHFERGPQTCTERAKSRERKKSPGPRPHS